MQWRLSRAAVSNHAAHARDFICLDTAAYLTPPHHSSSVLHLECSPSKSLTTPDTLINHAVLDMFLSHFCSFNNRILLFFRFMRWSTRTHRSDPIFLFLLLGISYPTPPLGDSQNLYTNRFLITHWLYIHKNFLAVAPRSRPRAPQSFLKFSKNINYGSWK